MTINLTQQKVCIVDADDFLPLSQFKWCAVNYKGRFYACRNCNGKLLLMHRSILGLTNPRIIVDHADGDGLNNTRANLRIATRSQNGINRSALKHSSKFKGVHCYRGAWRAAIGHNLKTIFLGHFKDAEAAARAYDAKAIELYGQFAVLNFPIQPPVGVVCARSWPSGISTKS